MGGVCRAAGPRKRRQVYGDVVLCGGLMEISNICGNDCYYCGIRKSNIHCRRYALSEQDIMACCQQVANLGFHLVLQGGESGVQAWSASVSLRGISRAHFRAAR